MNTRPLMPMNVIVAGVPDVGAVPYGTRRIPSLPATSRCCKNRKALLTSSRKQQRKLRRPHPSPPPDEHKCGRPSPDTGVTVNAISVSAALFAKRSIHQQVD